MKLPDLNKPYRYIFLVSSRRDMHAMEEIYDPALDLVLTYDYAVRCLIEARGGSIGYLDHLCSPELMQENNHRIYRFFANWHRDIRGKDIFEHRGIGFGFTFRIDIWNDFTFHVRTRLCLEQLRTCRFEQLFVGDELTLVEGILQDIGLSYQHIAIPQGVYPTAYYFPIHRWMDERLRNRTLRQVVRDVVISVQYLLAIAVDNLHNCFFVSKEIFIQEYHPSRELLFALQDTKGVRVSLGHFSGRPGLKKFLTDRPISVLGGVERWRLSASRILDSFRARRCSRLVLTGDLDVTESLYGVIERRITPLIPERLRNLNSVIEHIDHHPFQLVVLIANIGLLSMLVDSVAKARGIPVFLIINGLLNHDYMDEGKYATFINAYGPSIRDHYFRGMDNVLCLGDPRMDSYAVLPQRTLDRTHPTITVGTSGFNNVDLNSYLAVEFEFMAEVLQALTMLRSEGVEFDLVLKVRPNGYSHVYRDFCAEYFPALCPRILDQTPMRQVLDQTDFYISIYSQTLFEASVLGIPCVYHKVDRETLDPPFDGKSELVTTSDVGELVNAIRDFLTASDRFDAFLDRDAMARYVGPLDGHNLARNLAFVRELLSFGTN